MRLGRTALILLLLVGCMPIEAADEQTNMRFEQVATEMDALTQRISYIEDRQNDLAGTYVVVGGYEKVDDEYQNRWGDVLTLSEDNGPVQFACHPDDMTRKINHFYSDSPPPMDTIWCVREVE